MSAQGEKISYNKAVGRGINAIRNDCLSDGMIGKDEPCADCTTAIDALRALAKLVEQCEQLSAREPSYVAPLLHEIAAGSPPTPSGARTNNL